MLDAGETGRNEDLSDFDKGQIIMDRQLGQSVSETASLVVPLNSGEHLLTVVWGWTNHKYGDRVPKAHWFVRAMKAIPYWMGIPKHCYGPLRGSGNQWQWALSARYCTLPHCIHRVSFIKLDNAGFMHNLFVWAFTQEIWYSRKSCKFRK